MASASTQQLSPIPTNGPASPQSSAPRTRDWGRSGEPGSAFSGLSRGRGRARANNNNNRVSRGARGGRTKPAPDANAPTFATPDTPEAITPSSNLSVPPPAQPPSTPPVSSPVSLPASSNPKAKPTPRRPSRTVPSLVVDPAPPIPTIPSNSSANNPSTPRTPNRRNRSQQQQHPSDKLAIPDTKPTRPRKPRSNIPPPLSSKDVLPRLNSSAGPATPSSVVKTDIDALVERVRAVAMAENRPTTPGSHIDWAGDEDDSLPDLDDWGVTTGPNTAIDIGASMSPISVGGLTPLPEPVDKSQEVSSVTRDPVLTTDVPLINVVEVINNSRNAQGGSFPVNFSEDNSGPDVHQAGVSPPTSSQLMSSKSKTISPTKPVDQSPSQLSIKLSPPEPTTTVSDPPRTPLHPSLPPKPVAAVESLLAQSKSRAGIVVRLPTFTKSFPPITTGHDVDSADSVDIPASCPEDSSQVSSPPDHFQDIVTKESQGLSASIHAPQNHPEISLSNVLHTSRPTHHRSHTVGRSPQAVTMSSTISYSGSSTPLGRYSPSRNHHMRTHSSPADSPSSHRPPHATRPVITGDALSKLARTICNTSPTKAAPIPVPKD